MGSAVRTSGRLSVPLAAGLLRRELRRERSLAEWVDFAFRFHERFRVRDWLPVLPSIAPVQKPCEIAKLLEIVRALRSRKVLEIGTAWGGTLCLFARV
jgi:cephalosporin hydroxylase